MWNKDNLVVQFLAIAFGSLGLLLIAIFRYDKVVQFQEGANLSAKKATGIFVLLNDIGGPKLLFGFFIFLIVLGIAGAYYFYKKQKKLRDSINFGTLLKKDSKIIFDSKILQILKVTWDGKKYRGHGKLYNFGEDENWKPVEFSNLTVTNDGKSKLGGKFKYLSEEEWEAKGEDVNELPWNKLKQKEAELNTWNSAEGKCPACGAIINDDDSSCPECGLNFNSDASN